MLSPTLLRLAAWRHAHQYGFYKKRTHSVASCGYRAGMTEILLLQPSSLVRAAAAANIISTALWFTGTSSTSGATASGITDTLSLAATGLVLFGLVATPCRTLAHKDVRLFVVSLLVSLTVAGPGAPAMLALRLIAAALSTALLGAWKCPSGDDVGESGGGLFEAAAGGVDVDLGRGDRGVA